LLLDEDLYWRPLHFPLLPLVRLLPGLLLQVREPHCCPGRLLHRYYPRYDLGLVDRQPVYRAWRRRYCYQRTDQTNSCNILHDCDDGLLPGAL
jgi:hypothetical protein